MRKNHKLKLTLPEILSVAVIFVIIIAIGIMVLQPMTEEQRATVRDAQRTSDVNVILEAIYRYAADNNGSFPGNFTSDEREICKTGASSCENLYDISKLTDNGQYLTELPLDPECPKRSANCAENGIGYYLVKDERGVITVFAYGAENDEISATR